MDTANMGAALRVGPDRQVNVSAVSMTVVLPEEDRWVEGPLYPNQGSFKSPAWWQLLGTAGLEVGSNYNLPPTGEQKAVLEREAVKILRKLDPEGYVYFCRDVTNYVKLHPDYKVFTDFPGIELARDRFPTELKSLDTRISALNNVGPLASLVVGALAFVGGAIGAGNMADSAVESQNLSYVLAAAAGVVSAFFGAGMAYKGFSMAGNRLIDKKFELGEKMKLDLIERVEHYLQTH